MNVEVLFLAIEKRYFKNFEKSALHNGLYAVIYWCRGEVCMIPMTKLMATAMDTLETCNRGFNLILYSPNKIVFQEDNPLRCNVDRQLRITKDKVNEGGYILALSSNEEERTRKKRYITNSQAEFWFSNEVELRTALQVFCNYPLADTPERPCYLECMSTYYVHVNNIYGRMAQLYSGVIEELDHGWMFVDKNAYLEGELVVRHGEDFGLRFTVGGCTLQLNPWGYSNSAMDSWLVMFKTFIDKIKEIRK